MSTNAAQTMVAVSKCVLMRKALSTASAVLDIYLMTMGLPVLVNGNTLDMLCMCVCLRERKREREKEKERELIYDSRSVIYTM